MSNFKKARENAGFSQKEVAISLKVSAPTVSEWESGKKNPNADNLKALSEMFQVPIDYLLVDNSPYEFVNAKSNEIISRCPISILSNMYDVSTDALSEYLKCSREIASDLIIGIRNANDEEFYSLADLFEIPVENLKAGRIPLFPSWTVYQKIASMDKSNAQLMERNLSKEALEFALKYDAANDSAKAFARHAVDYTGEQAPELNLSKAEIYAAGEIEAALRRLKDSQADTPGARQK